MLHYITYISENDDRDFLYFAKINNKYPEIIQLNSERYVLLKDEEFGIISHIFPPDQLKLFKKEGRLINPFDGEYSWIQDLCRGEDEFKRVLKIKTY